MFFLPFLSLASLASAGSIGIPFFRSSSSDAEFSFGGTVSIEEKRWMERRSGSSSAVGLGTADVAYFANLALGTPPVNFLVLLDTGSADLVIETAVQSDSCTRCTTYGPLYDVSASSTSSTTNSPVNLLYGIGYDKGVIVTDTVTFGEFTATQTFAACNQNAQFASLGQVTGILGLGWQTLSATNAVPFVQQLWLAGELEEPIFGMGFAQGISNGAGDQFIGGGYLTLGGTNSSLYSGEIDWIPVSDNVTGYWPLPIDGISVNGVKLGFSTPNAIIDSGTNSFRLPTTILTALYSSISGSYIDPSSGYWAYPCVSAITLTFSIAGKDYPVLPEDFNQGVVATKDGSFCFGQALDGGADTAYSWILGSVFMQSYYTAFSFNPAAIGLAPIIASTILSSDPVPSIDPVSGTVVASTPSTATPTFSVMVQSTGTEPLSSAASISSTQSQSSTSPMSASTSSSSAVAFTSGASVLVGGSAAVSQVTATGFASSATSSSRGTSSGNSLEVSNWVGNVLVGLGVLASARLLFGI